MATVAESVWNRARAKQHTVVKGALTLDLPAVEDFSVIRVRCHHADRPLDPVRQSVEAIEAMMEIRLPLFDLAADKVRSGLRRKILGETTPTVADAGLSTALERWASAIKRPCVLVVEQLDHLDEASAVIFREMLFRGRNLPVGLVLVFEALQPRGAAADLIPVVTAVEGPDAVVAWIVADNSGSKDGPQAEGITIDTTALPLELLRVMRAAAVIGESFEVNLLAALLDLGELEILEVLQEAKDAGVPLEDNGQGHLSMPMEWRNRFLTGLLPSLERVWHMRIAEYLHGNTPVFQAAPTKPGISSEVLTESLADVDVEGPEFVPEQVPRPSPAGAEGASDTFAGSSWDTADTIQDNAPKRLPVAEANLPGEIGEAADGLVALARDTRERSAIRGGEVGDAAKVANEMNSRFDAGAGIQASPGPRREPARIAAHLQAAGQADKAAERYLDAALEAAAAGALQQAISLIKRALMLVETQPTTDNRRQLKVRLLMSLGEFQWVAAGMDRVTTLVGALETVELARELLRPGDDPHLGAAIAVLTAEICYDLGSPAHLDRAIDELTSAMRARQAAGDPIGAAQLLNDQAAVWLRLGDPVRAHHLLEQSRKVFEAKSTSDPVALLELAETHHLLARLTFHVASRPGREKEAVEMAIQNARIAEQAYRRLGATRESGRVWETLGRLEMMRGNSEKAMEHLRLALSVQQPLGDILGLARSTGALAEVLAALKQFPAALEVLNESVALNLEKGSFRGLQYNKQAFDAIRGMIPESDLLAAQSGLRALNERLARAEEELGRVREGAIHPASARQYL